MESKLLIKIKLVYRNIAESFQNQLQELIEVVDSLLSENTKVLTFDELYAKANLFKSISDLVYSYIKMSNSLPKISFYQKAMIVEFNKMKLSIDDSKLLRYLQNTLKEMELKKRKLITDFRNSNLDDSLLEIKKNATNIIKYIDNYLLRGNFFKNCINFLFNDSFGSLYQLKHELISRFNAEQFKVPLDPQNPDDKKGIDCLLIKSSNCSGALRTSGLNEEINIDNKEKSESVMLICNRSSTPYELLTYHEKWLECYLSYDINVVLWNYRGYGESNGFPTIKNIQLDARKVVNYLKANYNFTKIGVHGIGIGGFPASFLVKEGLVSFCFADRSFGDVNSFLQRIWKYFDKFAKLFFINNVNNAKMLFRNEYLKHNSANNSQSIDTVVNCQDPGIYKVVSFDMKNDYFKSESSLRNYISKEFYSVLGKVDNNKTFLQTILTDSEDQYETFINNLIYFLHKVKDFKEEENVDVVTLNGTHQKRNSFNYEMLDVDSSLRSIDNKQNMIKKKLLFEVGLKDKNEEENEASVREMVDETGFGANISLGNTVQPDTKEEEKKYERNNSNENDTDTSIIIKEPNTQTEGKIIKFLKKAFEKFDSASDVLLSIDLNQSESKIREEINSFFMNMLAWGSYKIGNVFATDRLIAYRAVSKKFSALTYRLSYFLEKQSEYTVVDTSFFPSLRNLELALMRIENYFMDFLFEKEENLDNESNLDNENKSNYSIDKSLNDSSLRLSTFKTIQLSNIIQNANIGNLLILNCGHEGCFDAKELEMYSIYLLGSHFIKQS